MTPSSTRVDLIFSKPRTLGGLRKCVSHLQKQVYHLVMGGTTIRRTNINLDKDLVDAAAAVLGTARITDTVHAALREVVDRAARERLTRRDFADLTPNALEHLRRPRKFA